LQKTSPKVVFSGETALYINNLMDREYNGIQIDVPRGYNASHLRKRGIRVRTVTEEIYYLGQTQMESGYGNKITVYDKERCICDVIKNRKNMDVQVFQTAMKEYMSDSTKKLPVLVKYAECMNVRDEVMKYVEVLS
jgi:hypothetical protein